MPPDELENPYSVDEWRQVSRRDEQSIAHGTFASKREASIYALALSHQNAGVCYRVLWSTGGGEPQPCIFARDGKLTDEKGESMSFSDV